MSKRRIEPFDPGRGLIARKAFQFRGVPMKPGDPFPPPDPANEGKPMEVPERKKGRLHGARYIRHAGSVAEAALPDVAVSVEAESQPVVIENADGEPVVGDPIGATSPSEEMEVVIEPSESESVPPVSDADASAPDEAQGDETVPADEGGSIEEPEDEPDLAGEPDE